MFYVNDTQSEAHVGLKLQLLNFKIIISPNISIFLPADILKQKDRRIDNTSLVLQQMISNVYKHMAFSWLLSSFKDRVLFISAGTEM